MPHMVPATPIGFESSQSGTGSGGGAGGSGDVPFPGGATAPVLSGGSSGSTANLTWSAATVPGGVAQYNVYRSADSGATYSFVASVSGGTLAYNDAGLADGTYDYTVFPLDSNGTFWRVSNVQGVTIASAPSFTWYEAINDGSFGTANTSIAYGDGKFAVSLRATSPTSGLISSTDTGGNWAYENSYPAFSDGNTVVFGNGIFLAGGSLPGGGPDLDYATSTDGSSWTNRSVDLDALFSTIFNHIFNVTTIQFVNGVFFIWINTDTAGNSYEALKSTDGISWTPFVSPPGLPGSNGPGALAFGGGKWVMVQGNTAYVGTSLSGLSGGSAIGTGPFGDVTAVSIDYGNGKFVLADSNNFLLWESTDGASWTSSPVPPDTISTEGNTDPLNVQFLVGQFWCSVEDTNGHIRFFSSTDALSWTEAVVPTPPAPTNSAIVFATDGTNIVGMDWFNGTTPIILTTVHPVPPPPPSVTVHSADNSFGFPFAGSWESAGTGYANSNSGAISDIVDTGSCTPSNASISGELIVALGVVTGFGWGSSASSPALMVGFSTTTPGSFSSVTFHKTGGSPITKTLASAIHNPASTPPTTPSTDFYVWPSVVTSDFFVAGVDTVVTFNP